MQFEDTLVLDRDLAAAKRFRVLNQQHEQPDTHACFIVLQDDSFDHLEN